MTDDADWDTLVMRANATEQPCPADKEVAALEDGGAYVGADGVENESVPLAGSELSAGDATRKSDETDVKDDDELVHGGKTWDYGTNRNHYDAEYDPEYDPEY